MNRKTLSLLLATGLMIPVLGIVTASQLQAQMGDGPGFGPGARGDRAERLIEELDLTAAQVEQIRGIRQNAVENMQTLHSDLWAERETLHDLMAGTATAAELRTQHETIQTLHRQVADQRFENMLAVREVLTPEQRVELSELMEQRRENRRGLRRGNRSDRGFFRRGDR